jgi:hypothetical protein
MYEVLAKLQGLHAGQDPIIALRSFLLNYLSARSLTVDSRPGPSAASPRTVSVTAESRSIVTS